MPDLSASGQPRDPRQHPAVGDVLIGKDRAGFDQTRTVSAVIKNQNAESDIHYYVTKGPSASIIGRGECWLPYWRRWARTAIVNVTHG